jgi:hypothetical protein
MCLHDASLELASETFHCDDEDISHFVQTGSLFWHRCKLKTTSSVVPALVENDEFVGAEKFLRELTVEWAGKPRP